MAKHGGFRIGAGRKPIPSEKIFLRLRPELAQEFRRRGGKVWLIEQLKKQ